MFFLVFVIEKTEWQQLKKILITVLVNLSREWVRLLEG